MHVRTIRAALVAALASAPASAESGKWLNLHLQPGAAIPLGPAVPTPVGQGVFLQLDVPVRWNIAAQAAIGAVFSPGTAMGGGLGVRYRLLDDDAGYLWHLGEREPSEHAGNLFGNVWVDADLLLLGGEPTPRFGFDVGLGIEGSLIDGLQLGPYARFLHIGGENALMLGLSLSIGVPDTTVHRPAQPSGERAAVSSGGLSDRKLRQSTRS